MEYVIGIIVGSFVSSVFMLFRYVTYGTLLIDQSNPEKDIYRIEFDRIDNIPRKKRLVLKINSNADLSQE